MVEYTIGWQEPTEETIKHMQWWVRWLPWLFAPGLRGMEISFSAEKLDRMSVVIGGDEDSVCTIVEKDESGVSRMHIVSRWSGVLKAEEL